MVFHTSFVPIIALNGLNGLRDRAVRGSVNTQIFVIITSTLCTPAQFLKGGSSALNWIRYMFKLYVLFYAKKFSIHFDLSQWCRKESLRSNVENSPKQMLTATDSWIHWPDHHHSITMSNHVEVHSAVKCRRGVPSSKRPFMSKCYSCTIPRSQSHTTTTATINLLPWWVFYELNPVLYPLPIHLSLLPLNWNKSHISSQSNPTRGKNLNMNCHNSTKNTNRLIVPCGGGPASTKLPSAFYYIFRYRVQLLTGFKPMTTGRNLKRGVRST